MKKLEIIFRPEKLEIVRSILDRNGVSGMNIVSVMGYGSQNGYVESRSGNKYKIGFIPKLKVEVFLADEKVQTTVDQIVEEINTGNYGDGKIAVYPMDDVIRIRTGEHGEAAL